MKIIDNRRNTTYFESLECGDCFTDENNDLYMKICVPVSECNAVRLSTGRVFCFEKSELVSPVNAELTIS